MTRTRLMMGASALVVAATAISGAASAQSIYGGGSSLIAPYWRQAGDCVGNQVPLPKQGSSLTNPTTKTYSYFSFAGPPAFNCAPAPVGQGPLYPSLTINYLSANSGAGVATFFSNSASTYLGLAVTGGSAYPSIQYAASDAGLDGSDIGVYLNGGEYYYNIGTSNDVQIAAPMTAPTGSQFPNPVALYGAPIQIPVSIDAAALAYSGVYKYVVNGSGTHSYHFTIHKPNKDGSGGLALSMPVVCGIFNGTITNWNDPAIQALNGNVSLQDPTDPDGATYWSSTGLPIEMVGRSDSSGTTSIFYRALAAQCNSAHGYTGTNNYSGGSLFVPLALTGPTAQAANGSSYTQTGTNGITTPTLGLFTVTKGSSNIAQYVALNHGNALPTSGTATIRAGQIGYIGPDYVLPAVNVTGANPYGLNVVDIKVGTVLLEPTPKNALAAFGTGANALLPPQSSSSGAYTTTPAAGSHGSRSAPQDWVNPITPTVTYIDPTTGMPEAAVTTPLADPNSYAPKGYPLVGTTQAFLYTCYASPGTVTAFQNFLTIYYTKPIITKANSGTSTNNGGLLEINGLAPMPKAWATAILDTFITPVTKGSGATNGLNLYIAAVGSSAPTQCHNQSPGA